jgi:hypothetical protein
MYSMTWQQQRLYGCQTPQTDGDKGFLIGALLSLRLAPPREFRKDAYTQTYTACFAQAIECPSMQC